MGLSGRSVGLSGRALCGVLSVVIAVGLGAGTGVAAVAADAALAASRAAARSSRPGLFVGVGLQGSWSEFLVFDLVCGIDLWIGSYGGVSEKWKISGFWIGLFSRFSGGFSIGRRIRYKSMDAIQVLVSVRYDSV